jgi:hypothetical protein
VKRGSNEEYTGQGCIAYIHNRLDQCPETQNAYMMQLYIETRYFCDFINGKHKDFQARHNPPGLKCIKII